MNEEIRNRDRFFSSLCKTHEYYPNYPDRYIYRYLRPGLSVLGDPTLNEMVLVKRSRRKGTFAQNDPKERLQSRCIQSASLADVS